MGIEQKELQGLVTQAVNETIENMAFMMVDTATDTPEEITQDNSITASLLILEPLPGELGLQMPVWLITKIAGALYGKEEAEVNETLRHDVLSELLNTLTGALIRRILPENAEYKLGLPECGDRVFLDHASDSKKFTFYIDHQPLIIYTWMEAFFN